MELTQPVDWLEKPFEGYVVNAVFSEENTFEITKLITEISDQFPDAFYGMPPTSLHVTLIDWIAPLVNYDDADKQALFAGLEDEYSETLQRILANIKPIEVRFNEIAVTPTTVIIKGADNGSFQEIRQQFINQVDLLPETKQPPQIIHSSLGRFKATIPLRDVQDFVGTRKIDVLETFDHFRLVHTKKEPMLNFAVLRQYHLKG